VLKPESSIAIPLSGSPLSLQPTGLTQSRDSMAPGLDLLWKWGKLSFRMKAQELNLKGSLIRGKKSVSSVRKLSLQSDEVCTEH